MKIFSFQFPHKQDSDSVKSLQIRSFFGPYFPVFGRNTESKNRKIRTRKHSVFGDFSRYSVL